MRHPGPRRTGNGPGVDQGKAVMEIRAARKEHEEHRQQGVPHPKRAAELVLRNGEGLRGGRRGGRGILRRENSRRWSQGGTQCGREGGVDMIAVCPFITVLTAPGCHPLLTHPFSPVSRI